MPLCRTPLRPGFIGADARDVFGEEKHIPRHTPKRTSLNRSHNPPTLCEVRSKPSELVRNETDFWESQSFERAQGFWRNEKDTLESLFRKAENNAKAFSEDRLKIHSEAMRKLEARDAALKEAREKRERLRQQREAEEREVEEKAQRAREEKEAALRKEKEMKRIEEDKKREAANKPAPSPVPVRKFSLQDSLSFQNSGLQSMNSVEMLESDAVSQFHSSMVKQHALVAEQWKQSEIRGKEMRNRGGDFKRLDKEMAKATGRLSASMESVRNDAKKIHSVLQEAAGLEGLASMPLSEAEDVLAGSFLQYLCSSFGRGVLNCCQRVKKRPEEAWALASTVRLLIDNSSGVQKQALIRGVTGAFYARSPLSLPNFHRIEKNSVLLEKEFLEDEEAHLRVFLAIVVCCEDRHRLWLWISDLFKKVLSSENEKTENVHPFLGEMLWVFGEICFYDLESLLGKVANEKIKERFWELSGIYLLKIKNTPKKPAMVEYYSLKLENFIETLEKVRGGGGVLSPPEGQKIAQGAEASGAVFEEDFYG